MKSIFASLICIGFLFVTHSADAATTTHHHRSKHHAHKTKKSSHKKSRHSTKSNQAQALPQRTTHRSTASENYVRRYFQKENYRAAREASN